MILIYLFTSSGINCFSFEQKSEYMYDEPASFPSKSRIKAAVRRNLAILYMRRVV